MHTSEVQLQVPVSSRRSKPPGPLIPTDFSATCLCLTWHLCSIIALTSWLRPRLVPCSSHHHTHQVGRLVVHAGGMLSGETEPTGIYGVQTVSQSWNYPSKMQGGRGGCESPPNGSVPIVRCVRCVLPFLVLWLMRADRPFNNEQSVAPTCSQRPGLQMAPLPGSVSQSSRVSHVATSTYALLGNQSRSFRKPRLCSQAPTVKGGGR